MPQGSVNMYFYVVEGGENKSGETNVPSQNQRVFVAFTNENTSFQAIKPPYTCLVLFHQEQPQGNHRFTNKSILIISQSWRRLKMGFWALRVCEKRVSIQHILQISGIEPLSWGNLDFSKFNFILRYGIMDNLASLVYFRQSFIFAWDALL